MYYSFSKCMVECICDDVWARQEFSFWKVLNYKFIFKMDLGVFQVFYSSWVNFGSCVFQGIWTVHLDGQLYCHKLLPVESIPILILTLLEFISSLNNFDQSNLRYHWFSLFYYFLIHWFLLFLISNLFIFFLPLYMCFIYS